MMNHDSDPILIRLTLPTAWLPEITPQHATPHIELDALLLEQIALPPRVFRVRPLRDLPRRVQHALPGHDGIAAQMMQRIPHLPGVPRNPGELRDLPVARDAPARNALHDVVDARVVVGRHRPERQVRARPRTMSQSSSTRLTRLNFAVPAFRNPLFS